MQWDVELIFTCMQACPMSTALIMDRSDDGWRKFVKATHHKLQLHASGSFLMTQSLAAAMYLLGVRAAGPAWEAS